MAIRLSAEQLTKIRGLPDDAYGEPDKGENNTFRARRTPCEHGHVHASAGEARRCHQLTMLERAGAVRKIEQQPKFYFVFADGRRVTGDRGQALRYTADFRYEERGPDGGWHDVVEDFKSYATMTEAARLRIDFFRAFHPTISLRLSGKGMTKGAGHQAHRRGNRRGR